MRNPESELHRLTLEELDAMLAADGDAEERRASARVEYRNRAQVICLRDDCPTVRSDVSLVWTDDVSETGVKLLLPGSIAANRFWIRFPGNTLQDPFIECRVQWRKPVATRAAAPSPEALHHCGVRFQRSFSRDEFQALLSDSRSRS